MLEYVDAWRERMLANGGIIPTNIGLDGKIGSAAGGKWYGGVYGWGFTVNDPPTKTKQPPQHQLPRPCIGFGNAYLLTGDDRYLDVLRGQRSTSVNAAKKIDQRRQTDDSTHARRPGLVRLSRPTC